MKDELIFCENIRLLRKVMGLSKKDFSKLMGVSVASLSKIERNTIPERMSVEVVFNITQCLGIEPKVIFKPIDEDLLKNKAVKT